jgi:hypothetical protein
MGRPIAQKTVKLVEASHEILQQIQPCTTRAVCYQLFNRKLIPSMSRKDTNNVSRILTMARERGWIPWKWIVDENRAVERPAMWDEPEAFADSIVAQYRKDNWNLQPRQVEVWSEKGTIRGTLAPVLRDYGVGFRVQHGYASSTAMHDAAVMSAQNDTPLLVLYVGDYDPSGLNMSEADIPQRLAEYGGNIELVRVALTIDDTKALGKGPAFRATEKNKDPRYNWYVRNFGDYCWELDALNPNDLRSRVEYAIKEVIDWEAWNRCLRAELAERESLTEVLGSWHRQCA